MSELTTDTTEKNGAVLVTETGLEERDDEQLAARRSRGKKAAPVPREPLSPELRAIQRHDDMALHDLLDSLGGEGAFQVVLSRKEPEEVIDPATNQRVQVSGHLKTYTKKIDDKYIQEKHGGGKYQLKVMKRAANGSYTYFTHRTIEIAGEPRLDDIHRNRPLVQPSSTPTDSPSLVNKTFEIMTKQLEAAQAEARAPRMEAPRGPDPSVAAVISLLQQQLDASNKQLAELRREMIESSKQQPTDPMRDRILSRLIDDDSSRLQAIRAQHESELRTLKENHREDEKRWSERADRERSEMRQSHEREIGLLRNSHEVAITAMRTSHEVNIKMLENENRRLSATNDELRNDNRELRAKKEKTIVEQMKDIEVIREAIGGGDEAEKTTLDKIVEAATSPAAIEAAQGLFGKKEQPAPPPPLQPKRQVIRNSKTGEKFVLEPSGELRPVRKKPDPVAVVTVPGEPQLPVIPQPMLDTVVGYIQRAFEGRQDPVVVAQSSRAMVPDEIMRAIRDMGVESFLTKVAKLPSDSPLSSQAGRNWLRKLGRELVGEPEPTTET